MVVIENAKVALIAAVEKMTGIEIHMFPRATWFDFTADLIVADDAAYEQFDTAVQALGLSASIEKPYGLDNGKRGLRVVIDVPQGWQPPAR
jgi:hypothetical protein